MLLEVIQIGGGHQVLGLWLGVRFDSANELAQLGSDAAETVLESEGGGVDKEHARRLPFVDFASVADSQDDDIGVYQIEDDSVVAHSEAVGAQL